MNGNEVDMFKIKRAAMVIQMADQMSRLTDEDIASRVVGLLILDKGNVNRWNETLHLVLDAHTLMHKNKAEQERKDPPKSQVPISDATIAAVKKAENELDEEVRQRRLGVEDENKS